jgi:AcrR family transcriptional regulator
MARQKKYSEEEVVEKAMNLFWKNGFESTSMQMLEKEMGINKFSIYSSFGSKNGLFIECLNSYKIELNRLMDKLRATENGATDIKQYFYDFLEFSKDSDLGKGCLVTNTSNEIDIYTDEKITEVLINSTNDVKQLFASSLRKELEKDELIIEQQADYLLLAMFGLSSASRLFTKTQLHNYIENTFKNI